MDRFFGEVKVDVPMSHAPAGKAAQASSRAKACFLAACVVLGAYLYFSQESQNAVAAATAPAMPGEMQGLMVHLAAKGGDPAAMQIRNRFYNQQDGVYCGEVNGLDSRGGELKFKDGVRVFVCGPGGRERDSQ
jgi:hypothetical protein